MGSPAVFQLGLGLHGAEQPALCSSDTVLGWPGVLAGSCVHEAHTASHSPLCSLSNCRCLVLARRCACACCRTPTRS